MYYQSSEELHELLMSCGNRSETAVRSEVEPLQALRGARGTIPCPGVTHFGLELLQLLFNAEKKREMPCVSLTAKDYEMAYTTATSLSHYQNLRMIPDT